LLLAQDQQAAFGAQIDNFGWTGRIAGCNLNGGNSSAFETRVFPFIPTHLWLPIKPSPGCVLGAVLQSM